MLIESKSSTGSNETDMKLTETQGKSKTNITQHTSYSHCIQKYENLQARFLNIRFIQQNQAYDW